MTKVIIDTSVWISTLMSKDGKSKDIIRMALQEKIIPQISSALFLEYEDVMARQDIQTQCKLDRDEQIELFEAYLSTCRWVNLYFLWRPNLKDENDNFLIELAVASNTKYLITYNKKDFLNAQLQFDIEVLTPEEFIQKGIQ